MKLTDRVHLVGSGAIGFGMTDPFDCHVYLIDALEDLRAGRVDGRAVVTP